MIKADFTLSCGGCDMEVQLERFYVRQRFHGFNGKDHGFGVWATRWPDIEAMAPKGWMVFDPYTRCTYCPDCVEDIFGEDSG